MKKACFCSKVTMEFPEKPLLHFMCHCTDCDSLWNGRKNIGGYRGHESSLKTVITL